MRRRSRSPTLSRIAEDARGGSWSLLLPSGEEAILIFTRKGFYRGGHSHDRAETSLLLKGRIHYEKRFPDGKEESFIIGPGETLHNEPGEVHLAFALEDYWLLDWKIDTRAGEATTTNYAPYRKFVDDQLKGHVLHPETPGSPLRRRRDG